MTKAIDYRKIIEGYNPNVILLKGLDRHILSVNLEKNKIEVFYSLWGVLTQLMTENDLNFEDCLKKLMILVQKTKKSNTSDVTYFFYDDIPNPQLN